MRFEIKRGELYYADLNDNQGSEQGGMRPVIIVQNELGNKHSTTTIIAPITSKIDKTNIPTHVAITDKNCGLKQNSVALTEQIRVIDKQRLKDFVGKISKEKMVEIDKAIKISLGVK